MSKQVSKVTKVADLDRARTILAVTRSDGRSFEYVVARRREEKVPQKRSVRRAAK